MMIITAPVLMKMTITRRMMIIIVIAVITIIILCNFDLCFWIHKLFADEVCKFVIKVGYFLTYSIVSECL